MQYFEEKEFGKDKKEEDLHDLIKKNPKLIFEDICDGEPILLGSEITLPSGKQLDLIFCDLEGNVFVVELKRDRSPREAIAQLLDYASSITKLTLNEFLKSIDRDIDNVVPVTGDSIDEDNALSMGLLRTELEENLQAGLKNPQLILVSYEIPDGIRRIASFLRSKDILINCVEFDYYVDEKNNEIFVPNLIEFEETKEIKNKTMSQLQRYYFDFFSSVIEKFKEEKKHVTTESPSPRAWMKVFIGYPKHYHLEWVIRGSGRKKQLQVSLHLENGDKEKNLRILNELEKRKEEISKLLPGTPIFRQTKTWGMVDITHPEEFDAASLAEKVELKKWAVNTMITFYEVFVESGLFDTVVSKVEGDTDERRK